ncbi:hypothetical protein T751_00079 [Klebsiella phage T751]|nr:hypothetical protein K751_00080 [Klebsiella phage K751]URG13642.1 hypothetical protein T751_00079 [Klebsiella phage T751]URG17962.1 hypothetical protein T765_00123 [Klebsiella phage T765]
MSIPNFLDFMKERDQLDEAFNSAPYELTMGKKNAGDVFFTFIDEDDKEYRIQFYTPQGLGKNVRQVFIGQKRGSVYPDAIARFKNPMRVIASMIEATKQFMATPLGKTIDGYAVNFSKKALDRGMTLIPKIIRQSGLKQKLNVMDLTYAPVPDRGYVWLVKKGKDPAQVFDGPKMQGITWDDPDKVGDVPVQNNTPDVGTGAGSSEIEVNREWYNSSDTGLELKSGRDPIRGNYVRLISGSKEVATFYGYDFDKYPDGTEVSWNMKRGFTNQDLVGASMTKQKKGMYDQYTFKKGAQIILVVDVDTSNDTSSNDTSSNDNGWKLTKADATQPMLVWAGKEKGRLVTANIAPHYDEPGVYVGAYMNEKSVRGQSADFIARQLKLPQVPISILNDFTKASTKFWKGSQQKSAPVDSNTTIGATSIDQLRDSGFIARVLGIIDTNIDQKASYLPGESIKRIGQARYQTKGGLVIIVSFDSVDGKNLTYNVFSEIESQPGVISGDSRRVANEIMETITYVAEHQYRGEWEINAVPMSAPYPIKAVRRSQGWGYVETANWTLKVADAILNRVKPGNTALLELNKEPLRGKHLLEIIPEKGDKTLMLKDRSGAIYGSIDLNAQSGDLVNSGTLNIPRNATVFGETVNGMSITWSGINFPETGKYGGAVLTTNVTYYYDKDKVAFTPMISQKGRILNNPKTYELPLKKTIVQAVIDEISSKMEILSRNMQTLKSKSYNPKQVFLDDIVVDDNGSVLWRGHDMADRRTTEFMLGILNDENSRLEKEGGKGKTAADLATYAASIEESAPKGRDLDWRVYLTNNGNSLQVNWEITFRRNTHVGAMKEFSAQVYRGNRYLEDVYADAKSRGYAPEQPNLMAMSDAQRSDDMAMMNGEDAYSEYEQSIGGSLKINLK